MSIKVQSPQPRVDLTSNTKIRNMTFYFGEAHPNYCLNSSNDKNLKAGLIKDLHTWSQQNFIDLQLKSRQKGGIEVLSVDKMKPCVKNYTKISHDVTMLTIFRFANKNEKHRLIGLYDGLNNIFDVYFVDYEGSLYNHGS